MISIQSKRKRRITVYGSVTRYGPQSVASASGLIEQARAKDFIATNILHARFFASNLI